MPAEGQDRCFHVQFHVRCYQLGMIDETVFTKGDGSHPTKEEMDRYIESLKSQGIEYFPCCDNLDEKGRCMGVEEEAL